MNEIRGTLVPARSRAVICGSSPSLCAARSGGDRDPGRSEGGGPRRPGPSAHRPRGQPDPGDEVDPAITPTTGDGEAVREALRAVVLDVARMTRRTTNALRRIIKRGDLPGVLEGADVYYAGEVETLAEAFGPALTAYGAHRGVGIDHREFAGRLVERARGEILACVEGPDTRPALAAMLDRWDAEETVALELLEDR